MNSEEAKATAEREAAGISSSRSPRTSVFARNGGVTRVMLKCFHKLISVSWESRGLEGEEEQRKKQKERRLSLQIPDEIYAKLVFMDDMCMRV